jgi:hypothetical protein
MAITVDIAERRGQPPVEWGIGEFLSCFVSERAIRPRPGREFAVAIVQQKQVRLAVFEQLSIKIDEPVLELGGNDYLTADQLKIDMPAVPDVVGPIVGDVEIERPVAIDIRQRQRCAAGFALGSCVLGGIGEFSVAVVQKAEHATAEPGHEQIQKTIAIDVGEDRPAVVAFTRSKAGLFGDIFESPITQILVERVLSVQAAKVNIRQAVVIIIPRGQA